MLKLTMVKAGWNQVYKANKSYRYYCFTSRPPPAALISEQYFILVVYVAK